MLIYARFKINFIHVLEGYFIFLKKICLLNINICVFALYWLQTFKNYVKYGIFLAVYNVVAFLVFPKNHASEETLIGLRAAGKLCARLSMMHAGDKASLLKYLRGARAVAKYKTENKAEQF